MSEKPIYVRIVEGQPLPDIAAYAPFRAVVVIDTAYSAQWQDAVSDWLVGSGCLYMMAWGKDCGTWDDSVDYANLRKFDFADIPDEHFVMTSWQEEETLDEVFWFAEFAARHGNVELRSSLIVHIGENDRREELLDRWEAARHSLS